MSTLVVSPSSSEGSVTPTPSAGRLPGSERSSEDWRNAPTPIPTPPATNRSKTALIIFLLGKPGVGRSTTMNKLFDDPSLCSTTSNSTHLPRITNKLLLIPEKPKALSTELILVHINLSPMGFNSAADFVQTHEDFSKNEIPNLILLVVNAADKASYSSLPIHLQALEKLNILDNNLLIVVTHADALGDTEKDFKLNSGRFEVYLQKEVVSNMSSFTALPPVVPVVFLEHNPKSYYKCGDFHVLLNGDISTQNLFVTMMDVLEAAGDFSAMVFLRAYFQPAISYKTFTPSTTVYISPHENLKKKEGEILHEFVERSSASYSKTLIQQVPLGFGFCPASELSRVPLTDSDLFTQELIVSDKTFRYPEGGTGVLNSTNLIKARILPLGADEGQYALADHGLLDSPIRMLMKATPSSRPFKIISIPSDEDYVTLMDRELELAEFTLPDLQSHISDLDFLSRLADLPERYDKSCSDIRRFRQFFSYFGTHVITKVPLGGSLRLRTTLNKKSLMNQTPSQVQTDLEIALSLVWSGKKTNPKVKGSSGSGSGLKEALRTLGITDCTIEATGGDLTLLPSSWDSLTHEVMKAWESSVQVSPSPIWHRVTLFPFYELIDLESDPSRSRYTALKEATKDYLEGIINPTTGISPYRATYVEGLKPISPSKLMHIRSTSTASTSRASTSAAAAASKTGLLEVIVEGGLQEEVRDDEEQMRQGTPFCVVPTPSPESQNEANQASVASSRRRLRNRTSSFFNRPFFNFRSCCVIS